MSKKVLTVDDSHTVRAIISKYLTPFSVKVTEAENGEEAIVRARENMPDLILLDYNMPVMDGYHTLVELKTDDNLKPIPVVMVTTETSKETVVKLLKLGLNDYIAKPFTREVLLKKVNPILKLYAGDEIPPDMQVAPAPELEREDAAEADSTPSVLVVDDKASIRELMKEYLGEQYQLVTADSGRAAIAAFAQRDFDTIFLDLTLPDMNGFDVLNDYLQRVKEGASEKKVIAMTLRSALQDIHRASELGVQVILYKPFTHADVAKAIEQQMVVQKELSAKKTRYLTVNGRVLTLECPAQKSSRYRFVAASLSSGIPQEVDDMVEKGAGLIIIKICEGFLSNRAVSQAFIKLVQHIQQIPLPIRLVSDSSESRETLKQFSETANIPIDVSLECALNAIAC
jgi:two-component system cell cycle response regulator